VGKQEEQIMSRLAILLSAVVVVFTTLAVSDAAPDDQTSEIEQLVQQLGDGKFRMREQAMQKLIKIGKPAVPALRIALQTTKDLEVRMRARKALQAIQTSLEYLIDELKGGDATAQAEAAETLGRMGADAKAAIPILVEMIKGKDERKRELAASALAGIDPENKVLMDLIPAKAHLNGKYAKLLRKLHTPQDRPSYGDYYEYGPYGACDWQGHKNIPAGNWVYVYPNWYIWGEVKNNTPARGPIIPAPGGAAPGIIKMIDN
jgi:hypothetical protein